MDEGVPADNSPDDRPAPPANERDAFDHAARVVYAVLLTIEAVWIADVISRGALSRAVEPQAARLRGWLRGRLQAVEHERQLRIAGRHVVFEAMTIAQEEGNHR